MEFATTGFDYTVSPYLNSHGVILAPSPAENRLPAPEKTHDAAFLRQVAWDIGEKRCVESYVPPRNHVALAMVSPYQGFAHWRILQPWIDHTAWTKGEAWRN